MKRRMTMLAVHTAMALLLSFSAFAQQALRGTLRSQTGEPLAGATIQVKGTSTTTVSDAKGQFNINAAPGAVLVISYTGFTTREITVSGTEINETLQVSEASLNEVVVIGYQSVRRKDLTGAVGVIDPAAANRNMSNTVAESFQGLTPGVTVRNTGTPGGAAKVDIRGAGTFAANNPLYIIDGMYSDATPDFNPSDIESIQILKDASAAAIYGSRAANGVIIITTKKGRQGPVQISGSVKSGVQQVHNRYDMMDVNEYRDLATRLYQEGGIPVPTSLTTDFDPSINTDWQDEFLRTGAIGEYNLSASGSIAKTVNFFISGNHFQNRGPVIDNSFSRSGFRINTNAKFGRLTIGQNVLFSWTKEDPIASGGVGVNPFIDMISMPPVVALQDPRYVQTENPGGWGIGQNNAYLNTLTANVPALQRLDQFEQRNFKVRGNAYAELRIIDGLTYRFNFGLEQTVDRGDGTRLPGTVRQGTPSPSNNAISTFRSRGEFKSTLVENTVNYDKKFGKHAVNAVAGVSLQRFDNPLFRYTTIGGVDQPDDPYTEISNFVGLLGRVNYNYDDRYLASVTFRRDGSSKFGTSNRWGNFPSASLAWRVSQEDFWRVKAVNDLKLRASYGSLGNAEFLRAWQYYSQINPFPRAVFGPNEAEQLGGIVTDLANANLRWETKKTLNFGLEASFLNSMFSVSADYFIAKTDDVLVNLPLSLTTGSASGTSVINAASIENKGIEIALTFRPKQTGDFRWDATVNFTSIRNKVKAFGDPATKYTQVGDARTELGRSIGEWYVLKTNGIFQNQAEIDAHKGSTGDVLQPWSQPGDIRYVDIDGDGVLDLDKDRYYAGSPWTKFEGGLLLNFSYKNFSVNMQWYGVVGNQLYNRGRYSVDRMDQNTNFRDGATFWTPQNPSSQWPRAAISTISDKGREYNVLPQSDRWLEKGDYLRLRNIEIGYNFSKTTLARWKMRDTRVFVSGQNLFTFTGYSGLDPDIVGVNIFERGLDAGQYPALRIVSAGIRFGF
ncbi:MAG: TonB-dependent receptor [Chitinophagaceae bacterium]|nr:MAG: TonB-dependent receptor [Chitinophagaceae bacterium]